MPLRAGEINHQAVIRRIRNSSVSPITRETRGYERERRASRGCHRVSKVSARRWRRNRVYLGYVCIPVHVRNDLFHLDLFLSLSLSFLAFPSFSPRGIFTCICSLPRCMARSCGNAAVRRRRGEYSTERICLIGS